ncbi:hypothetical protein [Aeromonas sp. BIGb0445]|uniref:hypothetical protein n=1 Tax=Aeromonas sp. BIGb0445 TaxID=2940593 RepID=UPI002166D362|nr:hypothetical protein [Aeromonas sp. BIGb0445]MCS3460168.1 hypothetical protein [Aeromonas sp. BIGb0445]
MDKRIKLFRMKTVITVEDLYLYFQRNNFSNESTYGFLNLELDNGKINSTYVEKESTYQEFTDPLGEVYEQTLITYSTFDFTVEPLSNSILILSITNPPRSIRSFVDKISRDLDYLVTFSPIEISIKKLLEDLPSNKKISLLRVKKLRVSGVKLNDSSMATIEITSKENAIHDLSDYTKNARYVIDKIKGSMFIDNDSMSFEITKTGLIYLSNDNCSLDFIFDAIQR